MERVASWLSSLWSGGEPKDHERKWSRRSALGVLGAALFLGDSMITPAISVLSAVEGLKVVDPGFEVWIVPITAVIIVAPFLVQQAGKGIDGKLFEAAATGACGQVTLVCNARQKILIALAA